MASNSELFDASSNSWMIPTFESFNNSVNDDDFSDGSRNATFIASSIIWGIIGSITVIINVIVLVIIIRKKKLHTTTNIILGSMFFSDILFAVVYIFPRWVNPSYYNDWLYCSLVTVFAPLASAVINMHLMVASVDKFISVQFPFHYRTLRPRFAGIAVCLIWILTTFISFLPLMIYRPISPGFCNPWNYDQQYKEVIFNMIFIAIFFILPLLVMIGCYSRMYVIAKIQSTRFPTNTNHQDGNSRKKHYKLASILGILVLVYFIMWTPFTVIYVISLIYSPFQIATKLHGYRESLAVSQYIAFTYPAVNPFLYGYFIPDIRNPTIKLFTRASRISP